MCLSCQKQITEKQDINPNNLNIDIDLTYQVTDILDGQSGAFISGKKILKFRHNWPFEVHLNKDFIRFSTYINNEWRDTDLNIPQSNEQVVTIKPKQTLTIVIDWNISTDRKEFIKALKAKNTSKLNYKNSFLVREPKELKKEAQYVIGTVYTNKAKWVFSGSNQRPNSDSNQP